MRSLLLIILLIGPFISTAAQDDGIPANCPYSGGVFFNRNWFVRTEPGRTAVVDWSTGAEVRLLTDQRTGADIAVGRWSPECQYVSVAYGMPDDRGVTIYTSVVYDLVNGGEIAVFEGARIIPYPLTWDTNSTRLLVETRFGAYIHYLGGGDVWLTSEADGNSRAFRPGTVRWDYAANQIVGVLSIPPFGSAAYDMSSGALVGLTDQFNRPRDPENADYTLRGRSGDEKYRCVAPRWSRYPVEIENARLQHDPDLNRIVLVDVGTREIVDVVADNVGGVSARHLRWLPGCRYLYLGQAFFDTSSGRRVAALLEILRFFVDPTVRYVVYDTRNGSYLLNLETEQHVRLNPEVRIETYGSGSVWSVDNVDWDLENNRFTLEIYYTQSIAWWYRNEPPAERRTYDLTTGELLSVEIRPYYGGTSVDDFARLSAQQDAPLGCRFDVVYSNSSRSIILRDAVRHTTMAVLDADIAVERFRFSGKSPDCRYVAAHVMQNGVNDTVIYDLATQSRVGVVADAVGMDRRVSWAPYGGYVFVHTGDGGLLWHLPSDTRTPLQLGADFGRINMLGWRDRFGAESVVRNFIQIEWDMTRGLLLGVPIGMDDRTLAFDIVSGQVVGDFHIDGRKGPVNFMRFEDGRMLVYTARSTASTVALENGLALWSLDSGDGIQLAIDRLVFPRRDYLRSPQFSPDGTRMVMRDWRRLYIWDLGSPGGGGPLLPTYRIEPVSTSGAVFIDNTTVEVFELRPDDMSRAFRTVYYFAYDVVSGVLVGERTEEVENNFFVISELPY